MAKKINKTLLAASALSALSINPAFANTDLSSNPITVDVTNETYDLYAGDTGTMGFPSSTFTNDNTFDASNLLIFSGSDASIFNMVGGTMSNEDDANNASTIFIQAGALTTINGSGFAEINNTNYSAISTSYGDDTNLTVNLEDDSSINGGASGIYLYGDDNNTLLVNLNDEAEINASNGYAIYAEVDAGNSVTVTLNDYSELNSTNDSGIEVDGGNNNTLTVELNNDSSIESTDATGIEFDTGSNSVFSLALNDDSYIVADNDGVQIDTGNNSVFDLTLSGDSYISADDTGVQIDSGSGSVATIELNNSSSINSTDEVDSGYGIYSSSSNDDASEAFEFNVTLNDSSSINADDYGIYNGGDENDLKVVLNSTNDDNYSSINADDIAIYNSGSSNLTVELNGYSEINGYNRGILNEGSGHDVNVTLTGNSSIYNEDGRAIYNNGDSNLTVALNDSSTIEGYWRGISSSADGMDFNVTLEENSSVTATADWGRAIDNSGNSNFSVNLSGTSDISGYRGISNSGNEHDFLVTLSGDSSIGGSEDVSTNKGIQNDGNDINNSETVDGGFRVTLNDASSVFGDDYGIINTGNNSDLTVVLNSTDATDFSSIKSMDNGDSVAISNEGDSDLTVTLNGYSQIQGYDRGILNSGDNHNVVIELNNNSLVVDGSFNEGSDGGHAISNTGSSNLKVTLNDDSKVQGYWRGVSNSGIGNNVTIELNDNSSIISTNNKAIVNEGADSNLDLTLYGTSSITGDSYSVYESASNATSTITLEDTSSLNGDVYLNNTDYEDTININTTENISITNDGIDIGDTDQIIIGEINASGATLNINGDFTTNAGISVDEIAISDGAILAFGESEGDITGNITNNGNLLVLEDTLLTGNYDDEGVGTLTSVLYDDGGLNSTILHVDGAINTGNVNLHINNLLLSQVKDSDGEEFVFAESEGSVADFADINMETNQALVSLINTSDSDKVKGEIHINSVNEVLPASNTSLGNTIDNMIDNSSNTTLTDYLGTLNQEELQAAVDSLNPEARNDIASALLTSQGLSFEVVSQQMSNDASNNVETASLSGKSGMSSGNFAENLRSWAQVFGGVADQGQRKGQAGYNADNYGFVAGVDKLIGADIRLGTALSYGNTKVDTDANYKNDIKEYQAIVYGQYDAKNWYTNAIVGASLNKHEADRLSIGQNVQAEYNSQQYSAKVETGYKLNSKIDNLTIHPYIGAKYSMIDFDGYQETGGTLNNNLTVEGASAEALLSIVGITSNYKIKHGDKTITPNFGVKWSHDFIGETIDNNASFTGVSGSNFVLAGVKPAVDTFNINLGVDVLAKKDVTVSVGYDYGFKSKYKSHSGFAKVKYEF